MSDNSVNVPDAHAQTRILRFTLGVTIAVLLAAWINWPLAFVGPVFTAKFLIDKPSLHKETVYELLLALVVTMLLGLLLTGGITQYPIPLLCLVGLAMLWGYYLFSDPKWNLFATILLIAVLMLPFMGISNPGMSVYLALGLAVSGVVAVTIFSIVHIYLPEPDAEFSGFAQPMISKQERWYAAFRAMLISFPVVCFFFVFQISEALLTMMFIALLSLMITAEKSVKLSAFLLFSNGLGGLLAIASFSILSIVPNIFFYSLFIGLMAIWIGKKIYTIPAKAPIYATAFSTLLVLVGSTLLSSGEIDSSTFIRLFQLFLIGVYMILASLFLETRTWAFLKN